VYASIFLHGPTDAVLCDCGAEFKRLDTLEVDFDIYVFDMHAYSNDPTLLSIVQEFDGISITSRAVPFSMGSGN
jgi:hypothetical protein